MPHPEGDQGPPPAPDQWDGDEAVNRDTAREVHPWQRMDQKNAPRNFRPVPVDSDAPVELPVDKTVDVPTVPKDSSALESATSSQESDSDSSETPTEPPTVVTVDPPTEPAPESPTQETPAQKPAVKASGKLKATGTSSPSSSGNQNPG